MGGVGVAIDSLGALRAHLQTAMEVEHSTLPPYLCALYSIIEGSNAEAVEVISSVVLEEMLHLTLAANLLNAVGGRPVLDSPDLRLIGLALVVTRDGGVPLLSHAYPGDRPDVTQFATVITELGARYRELAGAVDSLSMVYDAGQNSGPNHAVIETASWDSSGRCLRPSIPTCSPARVAL